MLLPTVNVASCHLSLFSPYSLPILSQFSLLFFWALFPDESTNQARQLTHVVESEIARG